MSGNVARPPSYHRLTMARSTLRRATRVKSKLDFDRSRKRGRAAGDDVLRITFVPNGLPVTRLGLAVPRRGTNVERNRIKRVIREAFRLKRLDLPVGFDLVVSPRDFERASAFEEVVRAFDGLAARLPQAPR
jgi:ribonuclease P protein component